MSNYVSDLNRLKDNEYHRPKEIKDQWRTPEWLFQAIDALYGPLVLDLFSDGQNAKTPRFFTAEDNALSQSWTDSLAAICEARGVTGGAAFANPPYSQKRAGKEHLTGMTHIMNKAAEERLSGARTRFLVKSATSESWWPDKTASRIIFIKGRIGFEPPVWFNPAPGSSTICGAGFGAAIILFDPDVNDPQPNEYVSREYLMDIGMPRAETSQKDRDAWIKLWDEV